MLGKLDTDLEEEILEEDPVKEDNDDKQVKSRLAELCTDKEIKAERLHPAIHDQLVSYCHGELF